MRSLFNCPPHLLALGLFASTASTSWGQAQQDEWQGSSGKWSAAANWSAGVPTPTTTVVMGSSGNPFTVTLDGPSSAVVVYASASAMTLNLAGNSLALGNGLFEMSGGTSIIDGGTAGGSSAGGKISSPVFLELGETGATDNNNTLTIQNGTALTFDKGVLMGNEAGTSHNALIIKSGSTYSGGSVSLGFNPADTTVGYNTIQVMGAGSSFTLTGISSLRIGTPNGTANAAGEGGKNTFSVSDGASFTTGGLVLINSSSAGGNAFVVSNGATATFRGSTDGTTGIVNNQQFTLSGGTVNLGGAYTPGNGSTFSFSSGTLNLVGTTSGDPAYFVSGDYLTEGNGLTVGDGSSTAKAVLNISNSSGALIYFGATAATGLRIAANGVLTGSGDATGNGPGLVTTLAASSVIAPGINSKASAPATTGIGGGTLTLGTLDVSAKATFAYDLGASSTEKLALTSIIIAKGATKGLVFDFNGTNAIIGTTYTLMTYSAGVNGADVVADCVNSITDGVSGTFGTDSGGDILTFTVTAVSSTHHASAGGSSAALGQTP